jgi:acyl-CoA reductase-like NAD-dependent aldehyde dehydrogenase
MKKEEIVKQLEATKVLSSQVDIDKVIALINQIEPETKSGLSFEDTQNILDRIERALDRNSDHLVNKDTAEFEINYGNTVELDRVDVDINEIMDHVKDAIDEFVITEEEEVEDDNTVRIRLSDVNE